MRANITLYDRVCYRPSFVVLRWKIESGAFFAHFFYIYFFMATQCRMCRDIIKYYIANRYNLIV